MGTLLKTDNVSFLIGAGSSISAGGVSLANIPKPLEDALLAIAKSEKTESGAPDWVHCFYETASLIAGKSYSFDDRQTKSSLADETEAICINFEDYLSHHKDLSGPESLQDKLLLFYDRQRNSSSRSNVVIIDLSLLASEALENVTALIGRLIHEFMQRLSFTESGIGRGEFPVVLVLEEAQNYIREDKKNEDDSISKQVFERISREGRKFGLGLVVASQRPSEISKTVLSQCNSFVVHRLQNPEDLRYFREIVPGIYGQLLEHLPALAPRSPLVLGECVQAPALFEMREVDPAPRSKNPQFFKSWSTDSKTPDIKKICAKWENNVNMGDEKVEVSE